MILALSQPLVASPAMMLVPIGFLGSDILASALLVDGQPVMVNGYVWLVSTES